MTDEAGQPCYSHLPRLTQEEFDTLVQAARSHRKSGSIISDNSVTMARAVLLEGKNYLEAAQSVGKHVRTAPQQAVAILLRYYASTPPVAPHQLFR